MNPDAYLDALLSLPGMYGAIPSPDMQWIAWTWFRTAPAAEVYVAPVDGSEPPRRLTDTPENTFLVGWTPDSAGLLVEQDTDGNERRVLYRVDLDTPMAMTRLTEDDPAYFLRVGWHCMTPDGNTIVYGANTDVVKGEEIEATWVYRHDLTTGERTAIAKPEKPSYFEPQVNNTGTHVLYWRGDRHPAGNQIWVVGIDGTDDRELYSAGDKLKAYGMWFPDGERVLILAEHPKKTHMRVGMMRLDDEKPKWLLDSKKRSIEWAFVPDNGDKIVINEVKDTRLICSLLNPDTGKETKLPEVPGNLSLIAPIGDQNEWLARYYSSTQPQDIVRLTLRNDDPSTYQSISRVWTYSDLTPADLTAAEDFRWASVDGQEIQGWLYRTPAARPRGTVIYVHGGPTAHSSDAINNQIQYLVREGFNVLDPNYRGSTGFGIAFREAIKDDGWGGREQDDIATGAQALVRAGISTPGFIGITGTSYGGYSSWCAITRYAPEVIAASAPICGMTDLVVDYETTRPDLRPYSEEMLGGSPKEIPEKYRERSPIHYVKNIRGHLLIVQGMQDPNVTPENVRSVTAALQNAQVEYGLLAFDDEGHGISKPKNQKTLYKKLAAFFNDAFSSN